jgi:hypothetical protein
VRVEVRGRRLPRMVALTNPIRLTDAAGLVDNGILGRP